MKKIYIAVAYTVVLTTFAEFKERITSKSFYSMQPLFTLGTRLAGWRPLLFSQNESSAMRITGGATRSYNSSAMAEYFLFDHYKSLIVRGSAHGQYASNTTNIRADWLGLPNTFEGTLSLNPSYKSWGIVITGKKSLQDLCDCSFLKRCSLFIELPIVHNETNLGFTQSNVSNAGPQTDPVYDILTAFNNKNWKYQKIPTTKRCSRTLSEIRLGITNTFLSSDRALVAMTSALSIPTTKKYKNEYMFEPQTGYNGHPAMISTVHMALPLSTENASTHFSFFIDGEHAFLIRTRDYKTFDLKNNPWSRFLLLRRQNDLTNSTIPAINILTRKVRFSPYSRFDVLLGGKVTSKYASVELGFGAWGHHNGRIKFIDKWEEVYGIAGTNGNTASPSTIRSLGADDGAFVAIRESDLDIESAMSPGKLMYKMHAALDAHYTHKDFAFFTTLGWEMQIPRNSTNGFKTWTIWLSTGGSF